jgi:son of sevenless-like protein
LDSFDSSSDSGDWIVKSVLCLHDFEASEECHLSFRKNEVLDIVKEEDSGWWAALRDDEVGWIPSTFVLPVSQDMAEKLRGLRPDIREVEFDAERLYNPAAPVSHVQSFYGGPAHSVRQISAEDGEAQVSF